MSRPDSTRQRIATAAIQLFADKGVDATSVRDIAATVGITEPAIYRHYPSKGALVHQLFTQNYRALGEKLARVASGHRQLEAKLGAMILAFCALYDSEPALFRFLLTAQHYGTTPGTLPRAPEVQPNPVDVLRTLLVDAIASAALPPQDPDIATALVLGPILQLATFHVYGRLTQPLAACHGAVAKAAWAALTYGAAPLPGMAGETA